MRKFAIVSLALCLVASLVLLIRGEMAFGEYHFEEWDASKRHQLYMTPIGVWFMPYDWFTSLETRESRTPIGTDPDGNPRYEMFAERLEQYGVIFLDPPPNDSNTVDLDKLVRNDADGNPGGKLPVGFLRSTMRPPTDMYGKKLNDLLGTDRKWLGQSCSGCHTGSLTYEGKRYRIDGGPAMVDIQQLANDMFGALQDTLVHQEKLVRFLVRLNLPKFKVDKEQKEKALKEISAIGILMRRTNANNPILEFPRLMALYNPLEAPWGFGRGDAFGRGGNTALGALVPHEDIDAMSVDIANEALVFSQRCEDFVDTKMLTDHLKKLFMARCQYFGNPNRIEATSPVSNPHFWNSWRYNRVEWNGSIQHPLGRNIGQAITTGRRLWFHTEKKPFESDVDIKSLWDLETAVFRHIPVPIWPKEFPDIKEEVARVGKRLYIEKCKACHVPKRLHEDDPLRTLHVEYDMKDSLIPVGDIGTEPGMARNFAIRPTLTGVLESKLEGRKWASAREIMERMSTAMMEEAVNEGKVPPNVLPALNKWFGDEENIHYLARPNPGIWATPPFLHNGSVPNLYLLLSPKEERDRQAKVFCTGTFEYDPGKVGYKFDLPVENKCPTIKLDRPDPQLPEAKEVREQKPLNTGIKGNENTGHEYRGKPGDGSGCETIDAGKAKNGVLGCELSHDERMALVEYLKTCDLDLPDILGKGDQKSMDPTWEGLAPRIPIGGKCPERKTGLVSTQSPNASPVSP